MPRPAPALAALLLTLTACRGGGAPEVLPAPSREPAEVGAPTPARRVLLATGYRAVAMVERSDSIRIALPDGTSQVQRVRRFLRLAVGIGDAGEVTVRLDSLVATPASQAPRVDLTGTTWRGQLTRAGLTGVRASATDPLVAFLTPLVVELFPAVPRGGVSEGERWADSSSGARQVEIFEAADQRRSAWEAGAATHHLGIEVLPIKVTEPYEQVGRGAQAGRELRMSAQGVRSGTYYVSMLGRIDGLEQVDSAQRMITIPSTRQAVPTTQVVHTTVRWFEVRE